MVDYWIAHYFRRPEYLVIDGKPVVIVFTPHELRKDMGSDAVRAALSDASGRAPRGCRGSSSWGGAGEPGGLVALVARGLRCGHGLHLSARGHA